MDNAIVIGGGPAGLMAASTLAEAGISTMVLEGKADLGGRAASERQHGFDLNQGPHALYIGGPAMRELKRLGIKPAWWNPVKVTRSVVLREGKPVLPMRGWGALLRLSRAEAPPELSVREWIDANVPERHRDLARAFVRVTSFVADHDALTADVARRQLQLGIWPGVRYLKGGWGALVDQLEAAARDRGAEIMTRAAVRSLERRGDGWVVATDDREYEAGTVIVAAGLPPAFAKLVDGLEAPGPPAEVSVLDLGFEKLPKRTLFALGLDRPTYFSKHSPPGHPDILMSTLSYAGEPIEALEQVVDAVQPGWRDAYTFRRHLPKMTPIGAVASPSRRPAVEHARGLFLAGDWIGPEGWLVDAALASGAAAARAAVGAPTFVTA